MADTDKAAFAHALETLRPYLVELVVAGGWAHRLHALHPKSQKLTYEPLATLDADFAIEETAKRHGKRDIAGTLQRGFEPSFGFDARDADDPNPPVCRWVPKTAATGFYLEFIAPLHGSAIKRGKPDRTVEIEGVTAQRLRFVDLLLDDPWMVVLSRDLGYPLASPLTVRVPNPIAFIVQKTLVLDDRGADAHKDLLYIHDTLLLFGAILDDLAATAANITASLPPRTVRSLRDACATMGVTSDASRAASDIARASGRYPVPSANDIARVLRIGLARVFG